MNIHVKSWTNGVHRASLVRGLLHVQGHAVVHFEVCSAMNKLPLFVRRFQGAVQWYRLLYSTLRSVGVAVD